MPPLLHICYSRPDEAWVEGALLPQLGLAEGQYWTRAEDELGAPQLTEVERAVTTCRYTLLVASRAASVDAWIAYAALLAQHAGLEEGRERLILVARDFEPGSTREREILPLRQRSLTYLDCSTDERMAAEVATLAQQLALAATVDAPTACPYPGLRAFGTDPGEFDRLDLFFGRDAEAGKLVDRLRGGATRLALVGTSGSGKSSLVRARVLPALRSGDAPFVVQQMRPGAQPDAALRDALAALATQAGSRRLLYVDQLEEVFLADDAAARARFFAQLAALDHAVLFSMRADFYADLMRSSLWASVREHRVELTPLRGDELRHAIVRPAEKVGVYVEVDLVERLVREADGDRAAEALPLLQAALEQLWALRTWRYLSLASYEQLADGDRRGLDVALGRHADRALADLPPSQQALAKRVLIDLVHLGEGRPHTRRRRTRAELRRAGDNATQLDDVIEHLAGRRLLTVGVDPAQPLKATAPLVDLAHDVLITGWPAFGRWVDAHKSAERTRRRFEARATEWARRKRRGGLLDDLELREFDTWLHSPGGHDLGATRRLVELVSRSTAVRTRDRRLRRGAIALLIAGVIAVSLLALVATRQSHRAREQEQSARHRLARSYVAQGQGLLLKGWRARASPYLLAAREAGADDVPLRTLFHWARRALPRTYVHDLAVTAVAWSPDGTLVASASLWDTIVWDADTELAVAPELGKRPGAHELAWSPNGAMLATAASWSAHLWDPRSGKELAELEHRGRVNRIAWSPNGAFVATASDDHTAQVWHVSTRERATEQPMSHTDKVRAVVWSPDGTRVATASDDTTVQVWNAMTGDRVSPALTHDYPVTLLAWSPDGTRIATGDYITARVWDVRTWTATTAPYGELQAVSALAWNPTGTKLAVALDVFRSARVWEVSTNQPGPPPLESLEPFTAVAWNRDGTLVAAGSEDGTVRIWDPNDGREVSPPLDHGGAVTAVAWSSRGRLVTASEDTIARVWDLGTKPEPLAPDPSARFSTLGRDAPFKRTASLQWSDDVTCALRDDVGVPAPSDLLRQWTTAAWSRDGAQLAVAEHRRVIVHDVRPSGSQPLAVAHDGVIDALAWSPDGSRIAIGGGDDAARIWDVPLRRAVGRPLLGSARVGVVAWSPDGARVATGDADGLVRVWDPSTGEPLSQPLEHRRRIAVIVWSPDGKLLATASEDKTVRIWDAKGNPVASRMLHRGAVNAVAWSQDGTRVATASSDRTARVWEVRTEREITPPLAHGEAVLAIAWSPDGSRLVTGSKDKAARLWDSRTGLALSPPFEHPGEVLAVAWRSDGTRVATASDDGVVRIWDASWDLRELDTWRAELRWAYPFRVDRDGLLVRSDRITEKVKTDSRR